MREEARAALPVTPPRLPLCFSRGGQIRTADLTDPNRARYQTALRPEQATPRPEGRRNMVFPLGTVKQKWTLTAATFQLRDERGHDLEQITNDAVVRELEDGSFRILVDGDDHARALHAGDVLDGA